MKQTHLKTLSATVDELNWLVAYKKITAAQFCNLILELNDDLKTTVKLGQFVASANGVPLENKANRQCKQSQCVVHDACGFCSCSVDYEQELNEAQKHVIFEGWEVLPPESMSFNHELKIANGNWCCIFSKKRNP